MTARERVIVIVSVILLPLFACLLQLAGAGRLLRWITGFPRVLPRRMAQTDALAIGLAVNRAAAGVFWTVSCLTRSFLLLWLLRCYGITAELRIGVRLDNGVFGAHAWVEHNGVPLNDRDENLASYAPMPLRN